MFNEENIKLAREILEVEENNQLPIFNLFKEDIIKLVEVGVSYKTIYKMLKKKLNLPISYSSLVRWAKLVKLNNNPTHTSKPVAKTKPSPSQKHKQTEAEEEKLSDEELDRLVKGVEHIWDMPPIEEKKRDDFF